MTGRRQCVRIGEIFSKWTSVTSGVPQGSVLGPRLFCMLVDYFSAAYSLSNCIKYADDSTILQFLRDSVDDHGQLE